VRATLWIGFAGTWAAGWWVFFSPLRRMRDIPQDPQDPQAGQDPPAQQDLRESEDHRAPGRGVPGHSGGEPPNGAGAQFGD
jgi:hypothetical protein